MFIDTHCHILKEYYDNYDEIIEKARKQKVNTLIISICNKKDIKEGLELLDKYDNIYASFGFHPEEIDNIADNDVDELEEIIKANPKIKAIGEIGLDYHYSKDKKEEQKKLFAKQLELAQKLSLPVVIHSRDSTQDTIDILKKYQVKGVIHCFSGSLEVAKQYIKMGYLLGIGGVLTFKNSKLKDVVAAISLDDIILETDSPYLAPHPHRGEKNDPSYIPLVAHEIAEIKKTSVDEVADITTNNAIRLFDLKK